MVEMLEKGQTFSDLVAERVTCVRKSRGMTAQDLAERCATTEVGAPEITAQTISNIETGRRDKDGRRRRAVTVDELMSLAVALQVPPADLLAPFGTYAPRPVLQEDLAIAVDRIQTHEKQIADMQARLARLEDERAATVVGESDLQQQSGRSLSRPSWEKMPEPAEIPKVARALVRERYPDLNPESGAGAARRWNKLVRLAEVVQEYQVAQARGEEAPAAAIAKAREVEPVTVRGWLHQAKREGIRPRPFAGPGQISE